ncbi:hypothetical protein [Desulfosarcina widdelii]|nr:hypothetical protein [Desulfosarcina widdelii]
MRFRLLFGPSLIAGRAILQTTGPVTIEDQLGLKINWESEEL